MPIGTYPATSLAAARTAAIEARGAIEGGHDPRPIKADTFEAIATEYMAREGAKLRSHRARAQTLTRLVYPAIGSAPITEVRRTDVIRLLDRIEDTNGAVMADRALALVRRIMNWHASRSDDFRSPIVRGMARAGERERDRVMTDPELRAIWRTAASPFNRYVRFLLLTATRRNEAANARWAEIDASQGWVWTIPAERYKTGRDHVVPLSTAAIALIDRPPPPSRGSVGSSSYRAEAGWLFGQRITCFSRPTEALRAESGTTGWRLHDLRRTARSLMSRAGVAPDIAERCLGHVIGGVREGYDRWEYLEEKRRAFEALAAIVEGIVQPQPMRKSMYEPGWTTFYTAAMEMARRLGVSGGEAQNRLRQACRDEKIRSFKARLDGEDNKHLTILPMEFWTPLSPSDWRSREPDYDGLDKDGYTTEVMLNEDDFRRWLDQGKKPVASTGGKQSRIIAQLHQRFPVGVPDRAHCPRMPLQHDLVKADPSLAPLDLKTLAKATEAYNASLGNGRNG
jgi:integrase